jgi:hypothetical protein
MGRLMPAALGVLAVFVQKVIAARHNTVSGQWFRIG